MEHFLLESALSQQKEAVIKIALQGIRSNFDDIGKMREDLANQLSAMDKYIADLDDGTATPDSPFGQLSPAQREEYKQQLKKNNSEAIKQHDDALALAQKRVLSQRSFYESGQAAQYSRQELQSIMKVDNMLGKLHSIIAGRSPEDVQGRYAQINALETVRERLNNHQSAEDLVNIDNMYTSMTTPRTTEPMTANSLSEALKKIQMDTTPPPPIQGLPTQQVNGSGLGMFGFGTLPPVLPTPPPPPPLPLTPKTATQILIDNLGEFESLLDSNKTRKDGIAQFNELVEYTKKADAKPEVKTAVQYFIDNRATTFDKMEIINDKSGKKDAIFSLDELRKFLAQQG